ncbi:MAG: YbaK/EbsC family protein [Nitrospirae bacterium]|nr:YbaK/EbsC family protein [Nitrospirota bacterium]
MICDKLKKYLDDNGVLYQVRRHGEAYTAQEIAESMHVKGHMLVKVVMIKSEQGYMMAALPADRRIDIALLRDGLGLKMAALASEAEFRKLFPDCEPGAMPPFGNLYGIPVYVDRSLTEDPEILFQAGNHYEAVRIKYADFARLVQPKVMEASRKAA